MSPAPSPTRMRDALRAAHLYYMQHHTMEAIARELAISRSSVSRLLGFARDTGLVDIRIRSAFEMSTHYEQRIAAEFGIKASVIAVPAGSSDVDRQDLVARAAARILNRFFDSNMSMGVAWGSTMGAISRHLVPKETHNSEIVQLNGAGNTHTTGIDYASEILRRFAESYSARLQQFPVPAFFDSPRTREYLWQERSMRRVLEMQTHLDIALFGIGSPFADIPSHVYIGGYLEPEDYEALGEANVVGDVATVFFRADGSTAGIPLNKRATGPEFDILRRIPRRVCVLSGVSKLPGLRGALNAGLITDLVIDDAVAQALIAPADDLNEPVPFHTGPISQITSTFALDDGE